MIDNFKSGRIIVRGIEYTSDVIIYADRVDSSWWRKAVHNLCVEDIESIMQKNPKVVIVGTGVDGLMQVPQQTRDFVSSKGANLIVEPTNKACEIYNQVYRNSKVVAALHLTC
jgi:hypothetical protein